MHNDRITAGHYILKGCYISNGKYFSSEKLIFPVVSADKIISQYRKQGILLYSIDLLEILNFSAGELSDYILNREEQ